MEEKYNYTKQEVKEMLFAIRNYTHQYNVYLEMIVGHNTTLQDSARNVLNIQAGECNKKIPKSLIDKLKIKKIE